MPVQSSIDIENPKQTIQSCFKMTRYVVPAFQREYVWGDTEIEQLLGDIEEAFRYDNNKEYFLGTTVVYKSDERLQLVDGQQRMTTFFLILCAIAKEYKRQGVSAAAFEQLIYSSTVDADGNTVNSYTLDLQYDNSTRCLSNIWEDNIPSDTSTLALSSQRLYDAYNIITTRLNNDFNNFTEYKKFASYFITKVVFIQIGATNIADALKIFETINQRGVTLNPMDLLKNMLFMQVQEGSFTSLNTKWKGMIDKLETNHEKPLRFLRYYLTATYDISDVKQDFQGIINEDDIYNWLLKNNDKCHYKDAPITFTDDMIDGLNRYLKYLNPDDSVKGRDYLVDIKTIMGKSYRLHLVPLLASKAMDDNLRERLFKLFDLIIYYTVVNNIKANVIERLFSSWCPTIRTINNTSSFDDFVTYKVKPTIDNWNMTYKTNFMNISMAKMQKYKIKTILARIAKYVDTYVSNGSDYADITNYMKSNIEIEHIMPDLCTNHASYGIATPDEYNILKNRLGNLTLLEKTLNTIIKNKDYATKTTKYKESVFYLTKSIAGLVSFGGANAYTRMNQNLKEWSTWDKDTIDNRQEVLYDLSKIVWDIQSI